MSLPPIVYHYTSLETAIRILNSFEMWCANVAFSNDTSEGVHGQEVIADLLAKDPDLKLSGAQKLVAPRRSTGTPSRSPQSPTN